jgi:hypothetical protein
VRAAAGEIVTNELWLARLGGFNDPIGWQIDDASLPVGSSAQIAGNTVTLTTPADAPAGAYDVRVVASSTSGTELATFRLVLAAQGADVGGPTISLRPGKQATQLALPIQVSWPAVAGARRYRVQVSVDEGPWTGQVATRKTKLAVTAAPGRTYRYRVQARVRRVWGEWRTGPSTLVRALEPTAGVTLAGQWQAAPIKRAYSELPVFASANGATAALDFAGRGVAWLATTGPDRGQAQIYVDGAPVAVVDLYSSTKRNRVVVWSTAWAGPGTHRLDIVVLGQPADRTRIDIDALIVVAD